jgi:drug/metabolite transporter (DMT)-like permease
VDDWLVRHVTLLGIPFQNWMIIAFALILIGVLINLGER